MSDTEKLIAEYPLDYCEFLEATYGKGMMSEGGTEATDNLVAGVELNNKTVLDIGSGLGGTATYIAEHYHAHVTGIDINEPMINLANSRIPDNLKSKLEFICYNPPQLPFADNHFDVVYSKGVLVHVNDKLPLFKEIERVLKPGGVLLIDDWLSPASGQWCAEIQKMCEMENLTLYAHTEDDYRQVLTAANFNDIEFRSENTNYVRYNQDIVVRLKTDAAKEAFVKRFGEKSWQEAITAYQLIATAISSEQLLIRFISAKISANQA